jgi:hypothetical protein
VADTQTLLYGWLKSHTPPTGPGGGDYFLVKQGVLVHTPGTLAPGVVDAWGRWYHAYQVRTIDGADSYKFQGTLVANPATADWVDITGHLAVTANGYATFTGTYRYIRVVKNSGTGTGTSIVFGSTAP